MFAGLLFIPAFIIAAILFGMAYSNFLIPIKYIWISVFPFAFGVGTYIIKNGLNEWWYTKYPPGLSAFEKNILVQFFPYYRRLNLHNKKIFENRLSVFRIQKQFQMRLLDKVPGDMQLLLCATGIQITMGLENKKEQLDKLGMIVLFPKNFITPKINTQLHYVEVDIDIFSCLLISIDMFAKGLQDAEHYYNSGIHGMAKVFKVNYNYTDEDIPYEDKKELLVKLHHLRGFEIGYQFIYTGLPNMELFEMCTEHFFQAPIAFQRELPEIYAYFMNIYQQDPTNELSPIIQNIDYIDNKDNDL